MTLLMVMLGGAVGAPARYLTDRAVQSRHDSLFPWGTFTVNVVGSFVLGVIPATVSDPRLVALLGTGFCGALTTYSTFGHETLRLGQARAPLVGAANVVGSLVAGAVAATLGMALGHGVA